LIWRHTLFALLAAAGMAAGSSGLAANTVPGEMVTGNVTAVNGRKSLNIQGRTYRLKEGSPAAAAAAHLATGQSVSVQLDGPANSPSSQVINVVTHSGR
jgi:hypothetical protein